MRSDFSSLGCVGARGRLRFHLLHSLDRVYPTPPGLVEVIRCDWGRNVVGLPRRTIQAKLCTASARRYIISVSSHNRGRAIQLRPANRTGATISVSFLVARQACLSATRKRRQLWSPTDWLMASNRCLAAWRTGLALHVARKNMSLLFDFFRARLSTTGYSMNAGII